MRTSHFDKSQVANLQQSNELSLQAVKKATDALAASQSSYERLCARVRDAESKRNALEDSLLDRRIQLQSLQKDVGDVEAECRRDEDVLRELELKDAAAAGGSVQVPLFCAVVHSFNTAFTLFNRQRLNCCCQVAAFVR